jgi:hypothetical protein
MPSPEQTIADNVERYGWHAISISDINPPFVYTVGLMRTFAHPEAIIFGLERREAHSILSVVVENLRAGCRYETAGKYDNVLEAYAIGVRPVHTSQHERYLGYAMGFCREIGRIGELQAVQFFWPDRDGRFPFEPNCDLDAYNRQPRLDIPLTPSELEEMKTDW